MSNLDNLKWNFEALQDDHGYDAEEALEALENEGYDVAALRAELGL
ncbi:hypothetical protein SEA_SAPO_41 [Gordonia phage Sapo]|nr:hypothetical protein SEA_SAPO_41 [Gordonia phage Sapo]